MNRNPATASDVPTAGVALTDTVNRLQPRLFQIRTMA
jgi:hypothetical protein